ncbi:type I polyketide synthase [Saccharothrix syringae]|uniref:Type I polyketide synthase n=1 Tax=Saccharothrix syringae TaxID=103733 RepID=A0A5Q0GXU4_SACSY|nr:type I polyketide synthase [Saccharothrix syringae]QFZ18310.1 type I polyketide synthase [Saccharothrix syringae]
MSATRSGAHRIAIVGMACRYPDANGPDELWQTVLGRRRAFRRIPSTRLSPDYVGSPDDPDRTYVTRAGLLRDWTFDRPRFGVPGPLHRAADHAHWLALQVAAEALADAGFPDAAGLDRDQVGVLLGNSLTGEFTRAHQLRLRWPFVRRAARAALERTGTDPDEAARVLTALEELVKQPFPVPGDESLAGALANTIAGRVCNHFDFHGTGYAVDGACASSLLAVTTACRALAAGELDFALAGGVDLSLDPFELVGFARLGALAVDEMRVYDAEPTGFLPGEGCGVVALVRAEDAGRAGLRTYAEILGWGTSSDGAGGLTRPEVSGQALALARAHRLGGVDPTSIDLVEGHGTGTRLNDVTELTVLRAALAGRATPAALGSVKANIGHTKAAAGVAGLVKAALAVHHRVLPPTTGCRTPHELLREPGTPLRVLAEAEPWSNPVPRAAVSAMGFGGINAHLVLGGAERGGGVPADLPGDWRAWAEPRPEEQVLVLGGDCARDLVAVLDRLVARAPGLSNAEVHDLAATAAEAAPHRAPVRCALVARTPDELASVAERARARLAGDLRPVAADDAASAPTRLAGDLPPVVVDEAGFAVGAGAPARVGLLFPGQASPVRAALPAWARSLRVPEPPADLEITDGAVDTAVAQPAIARQSLAGLAWLARTDCAPVGAVGHSLGEIPALVWAGALTARAALDLVTARGALVARYGARGTAMASLRTDATTAEALVKETRATIAALNGPRQTAIAGPAEDVAEVVDRARAQDIVAIPLPVSHGFHSAAMAPVRPRFGEVLARTAFAPPAGRVFSTVTGEPVEDPADLLLRQLVEPVRFQDALENLAARCDLLVEVGAGAALTGLARELGTAAPAVAMDCAGDPRRHALVAAALAAAGVDTAAVWYRRGGYRRFDLDAPANFLANPCEVLPAPRALAPRAPVTRREVPEPVAGDALTVLTEHLGRRLELPVDGIRPTSSLLGDLHVSSLQLLDLVNTAAGLLGRRAPNPHQVMASPTVGDVARVIEGAPRVGRGGPTGVHGVRRWVRAFGHRWVDHEGVPDTTDAVVWTGDAALVGDAPTTGAGRRRGLVVELRNATEVVHAVGEVAAAVERVEAERPDLLVVLHDGHPAAAGLARSVTAELPDCAVTAVDRPPHHGFDLRLAARAGYLELRLGRDGRYQRPVTAVHRRGDGAEPVLAPGDVCLVTGGVTGITARCAAAVAERFGATLVFLGRTPSDAPEVRAGLNRLPQQVRVHYTRCDVTEPADLRAAVQAAATCGPLRGLLHGAGVNEPRPLGAVSDTTLRAAVEPKVSGLRSLLDAVGDQATLVLAFGSVIGRTGMVGQAEYCVANDWMRVELERWAGRHPRCRAHLLEWTLWSGVGMGERLGVVDRLRGQGIDPITPAEGTDALLALLGDRTAPVTVVLAGRLPEVPTVARPAVGERGLRFSEEELTGTPGVESVQRAELSLGTDPYLDDHRVDGTPVLPAVVGLEAMAQAAAALAGPRRHWAFERVALAAPVAVGERGTRTLRVAALRHDRGDGIDVALRDDADGYGAVRFTAELRTATSPPATSPPAGPVPPTTTPPTTPPHPLYGPLFFHTGCFRRLVRLDHLTAFEVRAWVAADPGATWFSDFHSGRLLLGDPGAHDAAVHVLLACLPHRRALPVGVDRVTLWRRPEGLLHVHAVETWHSGDEYRFDVDVVAASGEAVACWQGLRLRAIGPRAWREPMPAELVGPWLSRRLSELGLHDHAELTAVPAAGGGADRLVALDPAVGLVARPVVGVPSTTLAVEIAARTGEGITVAANRASCAIGALGLGEDDGGERVDVEDVLDDGLVLLRAGGRRVVTAKLVTGSAPVVVAVTADDRP